MDGRWWLVTQCPGQIPCLLRDVRSVAFVERSKFTTHASRVSTLKAAIELKSVFDQIAAAEKAGNLSPEEKKKLEEQAAEKGLQALFKASSPS
jgi:hypothetical protein